MSDIATQKSCLRSELREQRRSLDPERRRFAAQAVSEQATSLPRWERAERIALYFASDGELDPCILTRRARETGLELYLPRINAAGEMDFALWQTDRPLVCNLYGIEQPDADAPRIEPGLLQYIFLPLVAWTIEGVRLGMGGGYYDRVLARSGEAQRVGLGYEFQRRATLPEEDWDIPMDFVATETALHHCQVAREAEKLNP